MSGVGWRPVGGGQSGSLIRHLDWAATPLGNLDDWSSTMRSIVQTVLVTPVPAVAIWGKQGIIIYNDGYAAVCGPRHPEAMGRPLLDVWPEAIEFNSRVIAAGLESRSQSFHAQELELWRHGRPEQVWMDLEYAPIIDDKGVALGTLALVIDVTERVKAARVLEKSESRLRAFVNSTSDMTYRMSPDWKELRQLNGRGAIDNVDTPMIDWVETFVVEEDRARVKTAVAKAVQDQERFEVETRVRFADGSIGWCLSRAVPITDSQGEITEWFGTASDITQRKLAELALAQSEERFRGVFESNAVGFSIFDANTGETLAANDKLLSLTGHDQLDWKRGDWDWRKNTPPDLLFLDEKAIEEARLSGFWRPYEKEFIHKNGRRIPVRLSSAPLPGQPGRVVAVIDDLTDQRAAEYALREGEERLRLATENAEVGFWDVDHVNGLLHWPPLVKAMFGIASDRSVSMDDFYAGLHPDDREATAKAYADAADPGKRAVYDVEYRTVGKEDGIVRWVAARGRGVFDASNRCIRVLGTAVNITRRKIAEERLKQLNETLERRVAEALSERKILADVVDGTDIFVQVADRDFNWLAINQAAASEFARIFGVRTPKAGDNMLAMLSHHPGHQQAVKAVWSRALEGEEFVQTDEFGDPSHDRRYYEMRFRTLYDDQGKRVGAYQFVSDITQRLYEQRRLQDAEAALAQAQKMEAIGQLTSGIAHDFNNLLQGVLGSLDLIKRKPHDFERVKRFAEAGYEAAQRGAKLTGQLLAFSRIQRLEIKPVPITELVLGLQDMIHRTIGSTITVHLDLRTPSTSVLGNEVQMEMAILNLALNARDAMPQGGRLTIATKMYEADRDPELANGTYVELSVSDTGTGMSPDVLTRAFDPFFTTKEVGKGTGLGLSQVYGLVKQAGGTVRIGSSVGKGTVVRLLLPYTHRERDETSIGDPSLNDMNLGASVLVVDDDPDVRRFLSEALSLLGCHVKQAEDGQTGLAVLERSDPDLIILDFAMPGMNGADVAKEVRRQRPGLPIIFATGFSDSDAVEKVAGDTPVLRKPFNLDDLQKAVGRMLRKELH